MGYFALFGGLLFKSWLYVTLKKKIISSYLVIIFTVVFPILNIVPFLGIFGQVVDCFRFGLKIQPKQN